MNDGPVGLARFSALRSRLSHRSHYYMGQREELLRCVEIDSRWLRGHGLDG